jgi:hypothetical protein
MKRNKIQEHKKEEERRRKKKEEAMAESEDLRDSFACFFACSKQLFFLLCHCLRPLLIDGLHHISRNISFKFLGKKFCKKKKERAKTKNKKQTKNKNKTKTKELSPQSALKIAGGTFSVSVPRPLPQYFPCFSLGTRRS